jgi:hypothetical protein
MSDEHLLRAAGGPEGEGYEWEGEPDLTSVSEDELMASLGRLTEEEREISYRRRIIQGRIDLIRSELVRRGHGVLSPEELARVLMDGDVQASAREARPGGGSTVE